MSSRQARLTQFLLLAVVAAALTGCSSPQPTMTLVAADGKAQPGQPVTFSGAFSKHTAGLPVKLQVADAAGVFTDTGQATTTDGAGAYRFSYMPTSSGDQTLKAQVIDGNHTTLSAPVTVIALHSSVVRAALANNASEVALHETLALTGTVTPASAGRTVQLESSPDGAAWAPVPGATGTTDATGRFRLVVPTTIAGALQLHAVVTEADPNATGESSIITIYVADYKTAGRKYLACVTAGNKAIDRVNNDANAVDNGSGTLTTLDAATAAYAAALRAQIGCFQSFTWPPSVSGLVKDIASQDAVNADISNQQSHTTNVADYAAFNTSPEETAAAAAGSADAAKIRRGLGLPARS